MAGVIFQQHELDRLCLIERGYNTSQAHPSHFFIDNYRPKEGLTSLARDLQTRSLG